MKFFFFLLFTIVFQKAFPHTIFIGTGSGAIIKNDMQGLHPGDTLAIRPGFYENGGSFSNLSHITIINSKGVLDFGQTISLGNLSHVQISGAGVNELKYGIRFRNMKGNAFFLEAPCTSLSISHCEYRNLDGNVFEASRFFTTYTGDTATMALYKTTISNQKLVHCGNFFVGSWAANSSFQNVVDSIAFLNVIIDSSESEGSQVIGHSIYRMLASDWTITGPTPNGKHDVGIFFITGNGTLRNIYRHSGWGYLWRIDNMGLNGRSDSYLYNCIDLSSDTYGTIDTRINAGDTSTIHTIPFCVGGNMHVLNNTTGNKRERHYVSVLVVAGQFFSENGYKLEVRNNLCFNNITDNANTMIKQNTGDALTDTSNNIYVTDPIAAGILLDTVECRLNPTGAAIDRAVSVPIVKTDIEGIVRPIGKAADIGAREFPDAAAIPLTNSSALKKFLIISAGFLLVAVFFISTRKFMQKKAGSRLRFQDEHLQEG